MSKSNSINFSWALEKAHRAIGAVLRWLGILFGVMPKAGRLPPMAYQIIHYVFVVAVTLILALKSEDWMGNNLTTPFPILRKFFLAIVFLLVYASVRLLIAGIHIWRMREISEFEDIERAFETGLEALDKAGLDLQQLPVFLINGLQADNRQRLFTSSRLSWKVGGGDESQSSALSFHSNNDAIFICLNDVGAMSVQLRNVKRAPLRGAESRHTEPAPHAGRTLTSDELHAARAEAAKRGPAAGGGGRTLEAGGGGTEETAAAGRTLEPGAVAAIVAANRTAPGVPARHTLDPDEIAKAVAVPSTSLAALSAEESDRARRRLDYFCQRLVEERGGFCPINGLLQVFPLAWTETGKFESFWAAAGNDLQTLQNGLHLQFPVIRLHTGLESINGLTEFVARGYKMKGSEFRESRAGSRFPGGLAVDEASSQWIVERMLLWVRDWVYTEFAKNLADATKNRELYQLLCDLSRRRELLRKELRLTMGDLRNLRDPQPVRLIGCYFAAIGKEKEQQAFVQGVLQRLIEEQSDVAWQAEWRERDRRHFFWVGLLAIATLAFMAADIYFLWSILHHGAD